MWRHRHRRGRRGRFPKPVFLPFPISRRVFEPLPPGGGEIELFPEELVVLRLIDLEGKTMEEAGRVLGVSKSTISRIVSQARRKLAEAVLEGRRIIVREE